MERNTWNALRRLSTIGGKEESPGLWRSSGSHKGSATCRVKMTARQAIWRPQRTLCSHVKYFKSKIAGGILTGSMFTMWKGHWQLLVLWGGRML